MSKLKKIIEKCRKQKTISTHLVLAAIEKADKRHMQIEQSYKESQHYSNKHQQLLKSEIKRLKEINQELHSQVKS